MKNFLKKLVLSLLLVNLALTINMAVANAAPSQQAPTECAKSAKSPGQYLKCIGGQTKLPNYVDTGIHPDAAAETMPGVATITSPIYYAIDFFRYVISTIAFILVVVAAVKLVSTSKEEEATKAKDSLKIGVVGLILIQLADIAVKKAFFGEQGEAFQDVATTKLYAAETVIQIRGVIGFLEVFLGATAVLVIIIRGFMLITSAGNEEEIGKAKKHILYALAGLIIIGLAEIVVRGFIFPDNGSSLPDVNVGKRVIVMITNYLSGFIAIISFLMLFFGGYKYVVSGGEDEAKDKVKKIIFGAVIGLILAMSAFAIVNTLVKFEITPAASTTNTP